MLLRFIFVVTLSYALVFPSFAGTERDSATATAARENEARQTQALSTGAKLLKEGRPAEAIENYLDKVIASYEAMYPADGKVIYCARSPEESLFYLLQSATDQKAAIVVGQAWCDAYFLRAYGLIDLGRNAEARETLENAIAKSPQNSKYLSELARVYAVEKNWDKAIAKYESAAQMAREFSPADSKVIELGRALRGQGFVLVELGRLDEAEAIYKQCLDNNPADKLALAELRYVQSQRTQQKP